MVMRNKPPKGPGNQSGFGTPGTQQTAQRNVRTGGMDPYNNFAKQAQRQGRSSYQRSLTSGAPAPTPTPGTPAPAPQRAPQRVPQMPFRRATDTGIGARELPRTGYEMLGGLPHEELLGMNQRFGLSNLTRIPGQAPVSVIPRAEVATPFTRVDGDFARATGYTEHSDDFVQIGLQTGDYSRDEHWGNRTRDDGSTVEYGDNQEWSGTQTGGRADFVRTDPDGNQQTGTEYKYQQDGEENRIMAFDEWSPDHPNPVSIDGKTYYLSDEDFEKYKNTNKYDPVGTQEAQEDFADSVGNALTGVLEDAMEGTGAGESPSPEEPSYIDQAKDALGMVMPKILADTLGYPEEEFEDVKDNLAQQAEYDIQNMLSQMYRQYAAMGISPASGAFAAANNQIVGQALNALLDKYTQLDLANLNQIEQDQQEAITGLFNYASAQQKLLQSDMWEYKQSMLVPLEALKVFDQTLGQMFVDLMEMSGGQMDDYTVNIYFGMVKEFTENAEKLANGDWTDEQWSDYLAKAADELGALMGEATPL